MEKHSITIAGHATSLSLEPVFWQALQDAARDTGKPLAALVAEIDAARTRRRHPETRSPENLSSAIRVWLFERARNDVKAG